MRKLSAVIGMIALAMYASADVRNIRPPVTGEGKLGTTTYKWGEVNAVNGYYSNLILGDLNITNKFISPYDGEAGEVFYANGLGGGVWGAASSPTNGISQAVAESLFATVAQGAKADAALPKDGSEPMTGDVDMDGYDLLDVGNIDADSGAFGALDINNAPFGYYGTPGISSNGIYNVSSIPTWLQRICISASFDSLNTYTNGPAHGKGSAAFGSGLLLPNGKALLVPHNSANIGIYDPSTNTYTNGPAHGMGSDAFWGGLLLPNGKALLVPRNSANIGIYDPSTNTYTSGPAHGAGSDAFMGGVLLPNGKALLFPGSAGNIGIYDPSTNTYTSGPAHGAGSDAFWGGVLLPNGKALLVPRNAANIGIYDANCDGVGIANCILINSTKGM